MNTWVEHFSLELKADPEIEVSGLGVEKFQESADSANGLGSPCVLGLLNQAIHK